MAFDNGEQAAQPGMEAVITAGARMFNHMFW